MNKHNENYLFKNRKYSQADTRNEIKAFIDWSINTENKYGGTEVLSRIAKNINAIFLKEIDSDPNEAKTQKKFAIQKFNSLLSKNGRINELSLDDSVINDSYRTLTTDSNYKNSIYKYYEYIQFKRCIFKCKEMLYDNDTGMVKDINYEFVKLR